MDEDAKTLSEIVVLITTAGSDEHVVQVQDILEAVGQRSFGPLLLVPGLLVLSPLSGIPGVPTLGGLMVLIVAGQLLFGRKHFWLPQFILRRKLSRQRMAKAGRFLMPLARLVDKLIKPRLSALTKGPFNHVIAAVCVLIAITMPPLEAILFANVITSASITAFGLALIARDGLLALVAFGLTAAIFFLLIQGLL